MKIIKTKIKNAKNRECYGEHHDRKSVTNKTQYFTLGQQVQAMIAAGQQKVELMQTNRKKASDIDRSKIDMTGIDINQYKGDKLDILERGRNYNEHIKREVELELENQRRAITEQAEHKNRHSNENQQQGGIEKTQ